MINNIGLPGVVLLIVLAVAVALGVIRPAVKRAKQHSTSVMFEISPAFWITGGVILAGLGIALYSYVTDPAFARQLMWSGGNPMQVQKAVGNVRLAAIVVMVLGGIFFMLSIARSILVARPKD